MTLTVHHLHASQSERVVWLCEELNVPYTLRTYARAPMLAPPEYKALHPLGAAPVIQDGALTLAESGACLEYISRRHGDGRLFVDPADPAYPDFLYWWYWGSGTFQPTLGRMSMAQMGGAGGDEGSNVMYTVGKERMRKSLALLDKRLQSNTWLAGDQFSVADIMVVFSLTTFRNYYRYSLAGLDNVLAYLKRVSEREAYQRAMEKGDPGMVLVLGPEPPQPSREE